MKNDFQVKPHQEVSLKVKHFLPPHTPDPEIHVMELSDELLQHTGSLSNLLMSDTEVSDGMYSAMNTSRMHSYSNSMATSRLGAPIHPHHGFHNHNGQPHYGGLYDQNDINYLRLRLHDNEGMTSDTDAYNNNNNRNTVVHNNYMNGLSPSTEEENGAMNKKTVKKISDRQKDVANFAAANLSHAVNGGKYFHLN